MSLTEEARELLTLLYDEEECISASDKALLEAALDVVDAAARIHVDFLANNGAAMTLADWRDLQAVLAKFKEAAG